MLDRPMGNHIRPNIVVSRKMLDDIATTAELDRPSHKIACVVPIDTRILSISVV